MICPKNQIGEGERKFASGGEKKNGPSYWLATKDAEKIVAKLNEETTGMSVVTIEVWGNFP